MKEKILAPHVQAQLVSAERVSYLGSIGKILKSGPLRVQNGAKIQVFEQNTDIIKFWLLGSNFQRKLGGKFT